MRSNTDEDIPKNSPSVNTGDKQLESAAVSQQDQASGHRSSLYLVLLKVSEMIQPIKKQTRHLQLERKVGSVKLPFSPRHSGVNLSSDSDSKVSLSAHPIFISSSEQVAGRWHGSIKIRVELNPYPQLSPFQPSFTFFITINGYVSGYKSGALS